MPPINNKFKYITDSHQSLFTILVYKTSSEVVLNDLRKHLEKIKEIKNIYKKQKLNDRIFKLMKDLENKKLDNLNYIILLSNTIEYINLYDNDLQILEEYSIPKYTFIYDDNFRIDWLNDLFENFNFYDVIINNSNNFTHYRGNLNKKKIISQTNSIDYLKNLNIPIYYVGRMITCKINNIIDHITTVISWSQIMEHINKLEIKKKNIKLNDHLINLSLNPDIYIFGNEIYETIEMYNVKELYIHRDKKNTFDKQLVEKILIENINFPIIIIESYDNNIKDSSNDLLNNFDGLLGIKYF